ncbi:MAG: proline-rich domain-containing protein [Actinomycetaceae bacterium]|nr:proline-rich domain-containing protein [Actinomycetaceae bacterium]MDY5272941.1 proline-rich domain-containing protein [Arcanobacterium sp.]
MRSIDDENINNGESAPSENMDSGAGVDSPASYGAPDVPDRGVAEDSGTAQLTGNTYPPVPPMPPRVARPDQSDPSQSAGFVSDQGVPPQYAGVQGQYSPAQGQYPPSPYSQGVPSGAYQQPYSQSGQVPQVPQYPQAYYPNAQGQYPPSQQYSSPAAGGMYPPPGAYPPQPVGAYPPPTGYPVVPPNQAMSRKEARRAAKAARAAQEAQAAGATGEAVKKKSHKGLIVLVSVLAALAVLAGAAALLWWFVLKPDASANVVAGLAREPQVKSISASQGADDSTISGVDGIVVYSSESSNEVWAVDAVRDQELWRKSAKDLGCSGEVSTGIGAGDYLQIYCRIEHDDKSDRQYAFVNVHTGESVGEFHDEADGEDVFLLFGGQGRVARGTEHSITLYSDPTMKEKVWEKSEDNCRMSGVFEYGYVSLWCQTGAGGKDLLLRADSGESLKWVEEFTARSESNSNSGSYSGGDEYEVMPISDDRFLVDGGQTHGDSFVSTMVGVRDTAGEKLWEKQIEARIYSWDSRYIVLVGTDRKTTVLSAETGEELDIPIGDLSGAYSGVFPWSDGLITYTEEGSKGTLTAYSPKGKVWSISPKLDVDPSRATHSIPIRLGGSHLYTMRFSEDTDSYYTIVDGIVVDK